MRPCRRKPAALRRAPWREPPRTRLQRYDLLSSWRLPCISFHGLASDRPGEVARSAEESRLAIRAWYRVPDVAALPPAHTPPILRGPCAPLLAPPHARAGPLPDSRPPRAGGPD